MKRSQSILCGIQHGPQKRDPTWKRTCGWTQPTWRDEEVSSARVPVYGRNVEQHGVQEHSRNRKRTREACGSPPRNRHQAGKRKTNAEECGLCELVHKPDGAHDVPGWCPLFHAVVPAHPYPELRQVWCRRFDWLHDESRNCLSFLHNARIDAGEILVENSAVTMTRLTLVLSSWPLVVRSCKADRSNASICKDCSVKCQVAKDDGKPSQLC